MTDTVSLRRADYPAVTVIAVADNIVAKSQAIPVIEKHYQAWLQGTPLPPLFLVPANEQVTKAAQEVTRLFSQSDPILVKNTGVLLRTSGSTSGQGKIVALSWEALVASTQATHHYLGGEGVWINTLPLYHIAGFLTVFRSLHAGFYPIMQEKLLQVTPLQEFLTRYETAQLTPQTISAYRSEMPAIYCAIVPAQLQQLTNVLQQITNAPTTISNSDSDSASAHLLRENVSKFLVGGATTPSSLLHLSHALHLPIVTSYGMTETSGGCVYNGKAIGDTQISLDSQQRITLSGSTIALGYLGAPNPAFSSLSALPRSHRTQDCGRFTSTGLEIIGRADNAINSGGFTIFPEVIENLLSTWGKRTVVVLGIPHPRWGETVLAISDPALEENAAKNFLSGHLEKGWIPRQYLHLTQFLPDWPLTSLGKINRKVLRQAVIKQLKESN